LPIKKPEEVLQPIKKQPMNTAELIDDDPEIARMREMLLSTQ
jgi:hypothetical protein